MPVQKRASVLPSSPSEDSSHAPVVSDPPADTLCAGEGEEENTQPPLTPSPGSPQGKHAPDSEGEDGSTSSESSDDKDEYILVKLADIRKEVQCPICLGIIRKTRTVMECLHRFCRECIDKSMRLGNNECPACRTHCASRRSLRDDPNYDALIAALYPDIDKYEEEELAFHEEEMNRNKKIQASIAETFRRQSEALGRRRTSAKATAAAFIRRSQNSYRSGQNSFYRGRGRTAARNTSPALSDYDEEEDANGNDAIKGSSSSEEVSPDMIHKRRRLLAPRPSSAILDLGFENYDVDANNKEGFHTSPLRSGSRELSWGKGGARSQTRHGNNGVLNGRFLRAARINRLTEYLHTLDENEDKFEVHLKLLPLNDQSMPLECPYLCCPPTSYISHIRQFIAIQTSGNVEGVDMFVRKRLKLSSQPSDQIKVSSDGSEEMQKLEENESLAGLLASFTSRQGDLELMYCTHTRDI